MPASHQDIVFYVERQAFRKILRDFLSLIETTLISPSAGKWQGDKEKLPRIYGYVREIAREEIGERFRGAPHALEFQLMD
jgi:hypothetical protein